MMRRPLVWLLIACGVGAAVILGFALSAPQIPVLLAAVGGLLVLVSLVLMGTSSRAGTSAERIRLVASECAFLIVVALGTYALHRDSRPWPGVALLSAAVVINAVLLFWLVRQAPHAGTRRNL